MNDSLSDGRERQGAAVGCALPRPAGRGLFLQILQDALAGIGLCAALVALLILADTIPDAIVSAIEAQKQPAETECRDQWTADARFVRHCNHHDGNGWTEE